MTETDSPAVELAPIREMLRMYCQALSERAVELRDLRQLIDKDIGWSRDDVATSDGGAIFMPALVERCAGRADNFEFLKVMATQQAGHIEFGSFEFQFDRPSTRFADWRPNLNPQPDGHGHHHDHSTATELSRFFRLFPNRPLARDIFAIVESARIEERVIREYRGMAVAYRSLRQQALALRPEMIFLPAREALIELLIRAGLGQTGQFRVPAAYRTQAADAARLLRATCAPGATVEDAAEATLRIYAIFVRVANEFLEEDQFAAIELPSACAETDTFWDDGPAGDPTWDLLPAAFREKPYLSPPGVDHRGEFKPELAQLLSRPQANSREQRKTLAPEELAELLKSQRSPKPRDAAGEGEEQDPQIDRMVQNLLRELDRRNPRMQSVQRRSSLQSDDDSGPLSANQPDTYLYDEWNCFTGAYRARWCRLHERVMTEGDRSFYRDALAHHAGLRQQIRREFELVAPERYRREKRLPDGAEHDLDAAIEALTDLRIGVTPSEKLFWRQHRDERDVAVAFLLDMSGSTGEAIATARGERNPRRIIDVEKEAMVLMVDALEDLGDRYGVFGFSGHGRDQVEFFVIKDIDEDFSPAVERRIGRVGPLHATRMGPAIRHAAAKLRRQQTRAKFLFLISDGRPQDRGYSQENNDKGYAIQDTRVALVEARREGIHPFCLTVDKDGNDYLRTMMEDFSYEVLADVALLPRRLPHLYRKLTA